MLSIFYARTSLFIVLNKAVLGEFSNDLEKAVLFAPWFAPWFLSAAVLTEGQLEVV